MVKAIGPFADTWVASQFAANFRDQDWATLVYFLPIPRIIADCQIHTILTVIAKETEDVIG
jgi:hypothetical protein